MKKTLLIDPFSGAGGDMILAGLVDAGMPADVLREAVLSVPVLSQASLEVRPVVRGMFAARQLHVVLPDDHTHRGLSAVTDIIAAAPLSDGVKDGAVDTFTRLARAEAKVHGKTVDEIHFHEVGALDAILDVVGFHAAVEHLGIEAFYYTELTLGSGSTKSAHGEIPLPSPATVELLSEHPVTFSKRKQELVTPTAAAIIASRFSPLPCDLRVRPVRVGYGAGTREEAGMPNILRVMVGESMDIPSHVAILTSTIDDMIPEFYGHVMECLFAEGALEVYFNPVMMKKNRPGIEVTVIAERRDVDRLSALLLTQTTTIGLRVHYEERVELVRRSARVDTEFGLIDVKVVALPNGAERASPEFECCRVAALEADVPIIQVYEAASRAWHQQKK